MTSNAARLPTRMRVFPLGVLLPDPRLAQMAVLGTILAAGACLYDFALDPRQIVLTFAAALIAQALTDRVAGRAAVNYRSALITALSIALLLRADALWVHPAAAAVAIGSKSLIRVRGKHLFNPSCLGVMVALVALPGAWVSPGQWGTGVALAGWIAVAGTMVVSGAARGDLSIGFVSFYGCAMLARVLWLGQRLAVWTHSMASGSLLLFAFFMISDPRTSPDDWRGRLAHSATVAAIAFALGVHFYATNSLLWALLLAAPAVPLWDSVFTAPRFEWETKGESDDTELQTALDRNLRDASAGRVAPPCARTRVLRLLRRQGRGHAPQQDLEGGACPS